MADAALARRGRDPAPAGLRAHAPRRPTRRAGAPGPLPPGARSGSRVSREAPGRSFPSVGLVGHQTDTGTDADSATDTDAEERTSAAPWPTGVDDVAAGLRAAQDEIVEQLSDWVRIPSVASQPERTLDVQRSARWLAGAMRAVGLRTEVLDAGGSPAVYGEWLVDPALPTVLVYSHHDVRHAKPEEWVETAPFSPVLRDGRLYGRGASDAKGQVVAHLWGLRAHLGTRDDGRPAVNLKYLVEGEEEPRVDAPRGPARLGPRAVRLRRRGLLRHAAVEGGEPSRGHLDARDDRRHPHRHRPGAGRPQRGGIRSGPEPGARPGPGARGDARHRRSDHDPGVPRRRRRASRRSGDRSPRPGLRPGRLGGAHRDDEHHRRGRPHGRGTALGAPVHRGPHPARRRPDGVPAGRHPEPGDRGAEHPDRPGPARLRRGGAAPGVRRRADARRRHP